LLNNDETVSPAELREFDQLLSRSSLAAAGDMPGRDTISAASARRAAVLAKSQARIQYAVGIELVPHRIVAVLIDERGARLADEQRVLADMEVGTIISAASSATACLMDAVPSARAACGRVTLGFQLGGPVDPATGTALFYRKAPPRAPGPIEEIRWPDNQPLGQMLEEATGLPSYIDNDANAYAMFQLWFGAGHETSLFAVVLISEGVGGALMDDGRLFHGPMELGNLSVLPDKTDNARPCDCGSIGCLETTGGIHGILENVYSYTSESVGNVVAAADLAERYDTREAGEAFARAGHANAKGIGVIVNFARPRQVVLYAPAVMTEPGRAAADAFLTEVRKFDRFCHPAFHRGSQLRVEPLRPYDGAHGAALLALQRCFGIRPGHLASTGEWQ
jgi:predicted NBD/HSP70 family sugar kinase